MGFESAFEGGERHMAGGCSMIAERPLHLGSMDLAAISNLSRYLFPLVPREEIEEAVTEAGLDWGKYQRSSEVAAFIKVGAFCVFVHLQPA